MLFCDGVPGPIRWSKADTRATVEQITPINEIGKRECEWGQND